MVAGAIAGTLLKFGLDKASEAGKGSGEPKITATNPAFGVLSGLFGVPTRFGKSGFEFQRGFNTASATRREDTLFDSAAIGDINDFLKNPLQFSNFEGDLESQLPGEFDSNLARLKRFFDTTDPAILEAVRTGFKTDVGPFREAAQREFQRELLPDTLEKFAGQAGVSSSDFGRDITETLGDIATAINSRDIDLTEAASARRLQAIPIANQTAVGGAAAISALIREFAQQAASFRAGRELTRPGARLFPSFLQLAGLGGPSNTGIFGDIQEGGGGGLGGLSQIIGPLSQVLQGLGGNTNGGSTSAPGGATPGP